MTIVLIAVLKWMVRNMRLIDADMACKNVEKWFEDVCVYDVSPFEAVSDFESIIDNVPTVDAEVVRHGRWELVHKELSKCSACGMMRNIRTQFAWAYCPNCGAKMDGDQL